jgi:hypothetical protein
MTPTEDEFAHHVLRYLEDDEYYDEALPLLDDFELAAFAKLLIDLDGEPRTAIAVAKAHRWYARAWTNHRGRP